MRKSLFFLLAISLSYFTLFGQVANSGKVARGERPILDLTRISKDSYYHNIVRIKVKPEFENALKINPTKGTTGILNIDKLSSSFSVRETKDVFNLSILNQNRNELHKAWGFHLWFTIEFNNNQNIVELISKYKSLKEVEIVEPVFIKQIIDYNESSIIRVPDVSFKEVKYEKGKWTPNDPMYEQQWHYNNTGQQSGIADADIDLPEAWELEKGSSDVIVAIIDGGIEFTHPDIQANMWSGIGYNFVNNTSTIAPHDHGTHVAGTIAAVSNNGIGVAGIAGGDGSGNGVRLMSCQVFTSSSNGGFELAPVYAADNGAVISQNSWGYTSAGSFEQSVLDAIDYFNANAGGFANSPLNGGITIFAAGNSYSEGQWYPGCYSGVMSVAATNNQDVKSWYSNYDTWVDISAPGGETNTVSQRGVLSTVLNGGYGFKQGTSMACPHTSGVAALVVSMVPGVLAPDELKELLKETTDNHYAQNPTYLGKLGTGRLNALNALNEAQGLLTGIINPKNFKALASGPHSVDLSWSRNQNLNPVVVAFNTESVFGQPNSSDEVGGLISGGGQILYIGTDTTFIHNELLSVTNYFYRIWSFTEEGEFSTGRNAQATTLCSTFSLPFSNDFTSSAFPMCWSTSWDDGTSNTLWSISNTTKAGGVANELKAVFKSVTGTSRLILPVINTIGVSEIVMKFKHFFDDYGAGLTFRVQTSTNATDWDDTDWFFTSGGGNINATDVEFSISQNLNSQNTYICFSISGNHYQFDNWYIDNIEIVGHASGGPSVITHSVTNILENSATLKGEVTSMGDEEVVFSGLILSTTVNPNLDTPGAVLYYTNPVVALGEFVFNVENLNASTNYYVRAFANNSIATAYGASKSFRTSCGLVSLPFSENFEDGVLPGCWLNENNGGTAGQVWQFGTISSGLSGSGKYAYLNSDGYGTGNSQNANLITPPIIVDGYQDVTISFNHYFKSYSSSNGSLYYSLNNGQNWILIQNWSTTTANPASFSHTITNLNGAGQILFRWNYIGTWGYYWCIDNIEIAGTFTAEPPIISMFTIAQTEPTSVELLTNVNPNGVNTILYFDWGIEGVDENSIQYPSNLTGSEEVSLSHWLTNLLPGEHYYVRARAQNVGGVISSSTLEFTTPVTTPIAGELMIFSLTSRSVELVGSIVSNGGSPITLFGLCLSNINEPTTNDQFFQLEPTTEELTIGIAFLMPNTTYFARLYIQNEAGETYSNEVQFTTLLDLPELTSLEPINITTTSALLQGRLDGTWGAELQQLGFILHSSDAPTIITPEAQILEIYTSVFEGETYSYLVENLLPETTYYCRAFAVNAAGDAYGETFQFTTNTVSVLTVNDLGVDIYPNPFNGHLRVEALAPIYQVNIYSSTGQLVYSKSDINEASFNLIISNNLPAGLYLFELKGKNGTNTLKRLLKN
jgi:subtilisin family serine protease